MTIFDKTKICYVKKYVFAELFPLFKGLGRAHMGPYGPEKSPKIRKEFAFVGAFKGPCTLPDATVCTNLPGNNTRTGSHITKGLCGSAYQEEAFAITSL